MDIIEYEDKYIDNVKDLLVELQEYIVSIDMYKLNTVSKDYRDKYFDLIYDITYTQGGKIYLAIDSGKVIGMIAGHIRVYDECDMLDYVCPKMGVVQELIVSDSVQKSGVGTLLMNKMEAYFKDNGAEFVMLDVFAYNDKARQFYKKLDYTDRLISMIKPIK